MKSLPAPGGWSALPIRLKRQLIQRLARRWTREPPAAFQRWGVLAVGFGWRVRESADRVQRSGSPVLTLMVLQKQSEAALSCESLIPRSWPVTRRVGSHRMRYRVPIDVCSLPSPAPAQGPRILASWAGVVRRGTACVLLQDRDSVLWVLGCHHVIADSNVDGGLEPNLEVPLQFQGSTFTTGLGQRRAYGYLRHGASGCVDAAAVALEPQSPVTSSAWGRYPMRAVPQYGYWEAVQGRVRLLTPRGIMDMKLVHILSNYWISYSGGGRACLREVALFEATDPVLYPMAGDSGSPAFAAGDVWAGMHVAGDEWPGGRSVVIPPHVLLASDVLGPHLRLAR